MRLLRLARRTEIERNENWTGRRSGEIKKKKKIDNRESKRTTIEQQNNRERGGTEYGEAVKKVLDWWRGNVRCVTFAMRRTNLIAGALWSGSASPSSAVFSVNLRD